MEGLFKGGRRNMVEEREKFERRGKEIEEQGEDRG
jgi:hypothetical protein